MAVTASTPSIGVYNHGSKAHFPFFRCGHRVADDQRLACMPANRVCPLLVSASVYNLLNFDCLVFVCSAHNWNTLFVGANAVADAMASKYGTTKSDVLLKVCFYPWLAANIAFFVDLTFDCSQ